MINPRTVGELIEALKQFDPNTKLAISVSTVDRSNDEKPISIYTEFSKDKPEGIPLDLEMREYFYGNGDSEKFLTISNSNNTNIWVY